MNKIFQDENRTSFENKINKNMYRFLNRQFYLKSMSLFDVLNQMIKLLYLNMSNDIKNHYFSVKMIFL